MLFSLNVYTRNEIYREFNRDHRELRPDRWAALSRTMTCAVENTRSPATGTILYRGDDRESYNVREGQQDRFDQFTSTSTTPRHRPPFQWRQPLLRDRGRSRHALR